MFNERGGYCYCGCGQKTKPTKRTSLRRGFVIGEPARYLRFHRVAGENHKDWNGGRGVTKRGYKWVSIGNGRQKQDHRIIAEKIYGGSLPGSARIHHFNCDPGDNSRHNLVICQDQAYHNLLHKRTRALNACGHADWLKCSVCKKYSPVDQIYRHGLQSYHTECMTKYNRELKARRAA